MKILFLPSWYPSSHKPISGLFFKNQFELLRTHNIDVKVFVVEFKLIGKKKYISNIMLKKKELSFHFEHDRILKMQCSTFTYDQNKMRKKFIETAEKINEILIGLNWKPDVIHVHDLEFSGYIALQLNKLFSYKYVITQHNPILSLNINFRNVQNEYHKIFINAWAYSFVSQIENILWIRSGLVKRTHVIGNYINDEIFSPSLNFKAENVLRLVSVTATSRIKNNELLIKSVSSLKGKVQFTLELVIATYYEDEDSLSNIQDLIESEGLGSFINIRINLIKRDDLIKIYQNSHVFISTSTYETFGVSLAESISCGCFGISLMNGGVLEIIENKINGLIINEEEMLNLHPIIEQITFNQKLREKCHESIKKKFGNKIYREKLLSFYK